MLERLRRGQTHTSRSRISASGFFKGGATHWKWHPNHFCLSPDEGMAGNKDRNKHDRRTSEWSEGKKDYFTERRNGCLPLFHDTEKYETVQPTQIKKTRLEEPVRVEEGCTSLPPCVQFGANLAPNGPTQASVAVWGDGGGEGEAAVGRQRSGTAPLGCLHSSSHRAR